MSQIESAIVARPDGQAFAGFAFPGSVVVLPTGKLLATFTGLQPRGPHRAMGAYSDDGGRTWGAPGVLFGGDQLGDRSADLGEGYADPNVVVVSRQRVMIFCVSLRYDEKVWDLSRTRFWRRISDDGGNTFGPVAELPRHKKYYVGMLHPGQRRADGALIMGYTWERVAEAGRPASGEGGMDGVSGVLISRDEGFTWQPGGDCHHDTPKPADALKHATNGLDEPAIAALPNGDLFLLGRTGTHRLWQSVSHDGGATWEPPRPSPLTSHNCPAALLRLADGRVMVVYNDHPLQRLNLSARASADGCRTWGPPLRLAPVGVPDPAAPPCEMQAAYPNACQLADGTIVVIFYQVTRGPAPVPFTIHAARFAPSALTDP